MRTRLARLIILAGSLGVLLAGGCASSPAEARDETPAPAPLPSVEAGTLRLFTRATGLLDASDVGPDGSLRAGDQVLLGLVVRTGDLVRVRYLRLSVAQEKPGYTSGSFNFNNIASGEPTTLNYLSEVIVARTELFDQDAKLLADTSNDAPSWLMGQLHNAMEVLWKYQVDPTAPPSSPPPATPRQMNRAETEKFVYGLGSLIVFSGYLGDRVASPMTDLLWEIVDRPSLLSMAFSGISISIAPSGQIVESARAPSAKVMRLHLDINGRPALHADITAIPRSRPLALASSIIAVDAVSPTDPTRTLTVRVLATKLGRTPPPAVQQLKPRPDTHCAAAPPHPQHA